MAGERKEWIEAGVDDYFSKPVKGSDLSKMLGEYKLLS